jgi:hypothetical protein
MVLGMSISTFTTLHVIISLIGIASGMIVLFGLLTERRFAAFTALFLATTVLTSVTGFLFPSTSFDAADVVGTISLVILAIAILAYYVFRLTGIWRWTYILNAVAALYLNVFVAVVQSFQKLPLLRPLAPTQTEPPFVVAQVIVLVIFAVLGIMAVKRYHPEIHSFA